MKKSRKKIWVYILMAIALLICVIIMAREIEKEKPLPREKDIEFQNGTEIQLDTVTDLQQESLYKLCKVWGYVKYRHPSVIDGTLNWDAELFRIMPDVLDARTPEEVNNVLSTWLAQFPFESPQMEGDTKEWIEISEDPNSYTLDTSWIVDKEFFGEDLCGYLEKLSQVYISERENAYAAFSVRELRVSFENETPMEVSPQDDGVKLLALFRFWNIYEYYSPNIQITKRDWDEVLMDAIPRLVQTEDYEEYVLEIAKVASETGDAHITVASTDSVVQSYYGKYNLQCSIKVVDGQVVVASALNKGEQSLKPGDILTEIDGVSIEERIETLSQYVVLPEEDKIVNKMSGPLLRVEGETAKVKVIRSGKQEILHVNASKDLFQPKKTYKNGLLDNEDIGYIDPACLKEGQVEKMMEEFADTKGIIIDLREYPSVFLPYLLGEYITPEPKQFARMSLQNRAIPGSFFVVEEFKSGAGVMKKNETSQKAPSIYNGKVVILMDETSQSQSEFTIMALRQSPNAVVVGSPSIGADGDVVKVSLPGRVNMRISSLGVFTPDGGQTQRVGLVPDVECYPTVEGLRENRDELMEKAIEIIEGK